MRAVLTLAATGIASTVLLSGCAASSVTAARLDAAIGPTFARMYAHQQEELGRYGHQTPDGRARCHRSNAGSPTRGAGDDWLCVVNFPYPDGDVQPLTYEVEVQPTGCYTASGPTQIVGPQRQRDAQDTTVTNPLFEFDGCFDVS